MAVSWITGGDTENPTDFNADYAAASASWILYKLTAEKYPGIQTATEWYGLRGSSCWSCEALLADHFHIYTEGSFGASRYLPLRHRPIISVTTVSTINGDLPSSDYKVVNRSTLTLGGQECWDLYNGVTVEYKFGVRPPEAGILAAKRLANELMLGMSGSTDCALPANVESLTRQGVSYDMLDPNTLLVDGRSGIYEIDLFILAANPNKAKKRPRVFSVDIPRGERYL